MIVYRKKIHENFDQIISQFVKTPYKFKHKKCDDMMKNCANLLLMKSLYEERLFVCFVLFIMVTFPKF
jgi:hypothetical protein